MTAPTLTDTLTELNDLCQFFKDAEAGLKSGRMTDLSGVDARISAVCKTVQDAVPAQQQQYLPELTVLISLLNSYEKELRILKAIADGEGGGEDAGCTPQETEIDNANL